MSTQFNLPTEVVYTSLAGVIEEAEKTGRFVWYNFEDRHYVTCALVCAKKVQAIKFHEKMRELGYTQHKTALKGVGYYYKVEKPK